MPKRKKRKRRCLWCGQEITSRTAQQFCGPVCLGLAYRRRMEERAAHKPDPPPPPEPTRCLPGTRGKVRVLARRFLAGQSLWRPDDAHWDLEPGG